MYFVHCNLKQVISISIWYKSFCFTNVLVWQLPSWNGDSQSKDNCGIGIGIRGKWNSKILEVSSRALKQREIGLSSSDKRIKNPLSFVNVKENRIGRKNRRQVIYVRNQELQERRNMKTKEEKIEELFYSSFLKTISVILLARFQDIYLFEERGWDDEEEDRKGERISNQAWYWISDIRRKEKQSPRRVIWLSLSPFFGSEK